MGRRSRMVHISLAVSPRVVLVAMRSARFGDTVGEVCPRTPGKKEATPSTPMLASTELSWIARTVVPRGSQSRANAVEIRKCVDPLPTATRLDHCEPARAVVYG